MSDYPYYDMDGERCSQERWLELWNDPARLLAQDYVGHYFVSTVWLGIDHGWGMIRPLLFETMVFDQSGESPYLDLEQRRYSTREEAMEGHARLLEEVRLTTEWGRTETPEGGECPPTGNPSDRSCSS